jgi:hypothetical protein
MTTANEIDNLPAYADHPELTKREANVLMRVYQTLLVDPTDCVKATDYVLAASSIYAMALHRADPDDFACWDTDRECFRYRDHIQHTRNTFMQWRGWSKNPSEDEAKEVYQARLTLLDMAIAEADGLLRMECGRFDDEDTALLHRFDYALNILPCQPYT